MKQYGIPTAGYEVFDDSASAIAYIEQIIHLRLSLKQRACIRKRCYHR